MRKRTKGNTKYWSAKHNIMNNPLSVENWGDAMSREEEKFSEFEYYYADQIPPFDVAITMHNEYGGSAMMQVIGLEILNEGTGLSIDDIVTEQAFTFAARQVQRIQRSKNSYQ